MSALLTVEEAARQLRAKTARFVRDEIKRKKLRAALIGGRWLIEQADLDAYKDAHANVSKVRGR